MYWRDGATSDVVPIDERRNASNSTLFGLLKHRLELLACAVVGKRVGDDLRAYVDSRRERPKHVTVADISAFDSKSVVDCGVERSPPVGVSRFHHV